jgi:hypothetical protein
MREPVSSLDIMQILSDELMLVRAGVLPESERDYYRVRPEKWRHEIASCRLQERVMLAAGIDPAEGWEMTAAEIVRAGIRRGIRTAVEMHRS